MYNDKNQAFIDKKGTRIDIYVPVWVHNQPPIT